MPETTNLDNSTFEIVIFSTIEGATKENLLEAAETVSAWAKAQPGFIDRKLLHATDDKYVEIVRWESIEHAQTAAEVAESSPQCAPMFSMIDMESTVFLHGSSVLEASA